jgi:dynein heavy chain
VKEEDFEALEGDQLTVQGMLASRHVGHFETQVQQWQHSLASISDVYTFVTEIQRTWSYLEPLFVGSEEVKKELPEDAERFKGIDVDVKSMLKEMWHVCNIKAACNEHGLSARCEGILELLGICKKSLADFLDGRRRQFPRYYFTSEADLLDILSNGSQPKKILHHTPKVYLQTKTFRLSDDDHVTETGRPVALGWTAGVGIEEVDFEPPVSILFLLRTDL